MVKKLSVRSYRASQLSSSSSSSPTPLSSSRPNNTNRQKELLSHVTKLKSKSKSVSASDLEKSSSSSSSSSSRQCFPKLGFSCSLRCAMFTFGGLALMYSFVVVIQQQYHLVKNVTNNNNNIPYQQQQNQQQHTFGIMPIALDLEHLLFHHHFGNDNNNDNGINNNDMNDNNSGNTNSAADTADSSVVNHGLDLDRFEALIAQSKEISESQKEILSEIILALQSEKQQKESIITTTKYNNNNDNDNEKVDNNNNQQRQQQSNKKLLGTFISTGDTNDDISKVVPTSPYAYMFVIGGINPDRPSYRGYLYDVLVATYLFRQQFHSTADIWLYVQKVSSDSDGTEEEEENNNNNDNNNNEWVLPNDEIQHLRSMNIHIHQLPNAEHETFTHLVFSKFRALQMTQYRRVIFVDADIIPLANLDYLFHLSDPLHTETPTILQPNVILATRAEPCNAGLFMVQPEEGGWDELWQIVQRQRQEGAEMPYPHFDSSTGWGYNFEQEHDYWRGTSRAGKKWKFHAAHSDQGLLYYWAKYVKQHTSIIIRDEIENWIPNPIKGSTKPILSNTLYNETLLQYSSKEPLEYQMECDRQVKTNDNANTANINDNTDIRLQCYVPYRDYCHFVGSSKPWEKANPKRFRRIGAIKTENFLAPTKLFFDTLDILNTRLNLGIDFDSWHVNHLPHFQNNSIGRMSMYHEIALDVMKIKNMTRQEYDTWQGFDNNNKKKKNDNDQNNDE